MSRLKDISFIATTTNRYVCYESLVLSIRKNFGTEVEIFFSFQQDMLRPQDVQFANRYNVKLFATAFDSGLSYNRNFLLEKVSSKYLVLCDDDFIFSKKVNLLNAIALMECKKIDVLGGYYKNFLCDTNNVLKNYERSEFAFHLSHRNGILNKTLVKSIEYEVSEKNAFQYVICHCVNNFAVMNVKKLRSSPLRWDEAMKISGEHIDFYVNNYINDYLRVAYSPDLFVNHLRRTNPEYNQMRKRREGLNVFESKVNEYFK